MCKYQNNQFIRLYLFIECIFLLTTTEWPIVRSLSLSIAVVINFPSAFFHRNIATIFICTIQIWFYSKKVNSTESTDNWTDWSAHIQCTMAFSCHVLRFFLRHRSDGKMTNCPSRVNFIAYRCLSTDDFIAREWKNVHSWNGFATRL